MINKRYFKTKDEVEVTFALEANGADSVSLVADFLNWQEEPMKKNKKDKVFKYKTRLPKGQEFQFRYLVDGQEWVNDAQADRYVPNTFGQDNALLSTAE